MAKKKKQIPVKVSRAEAQVKDFFDMISPATMKFNADHFICGDTYRSVWAVREYPPQTSDQAILCHLGDKENVTLHIYSRYVDNVEQRKIFQNATRKNRMLSTSDDVQEAVTAEGNMEDVVTLLSELHKNKEPLLHCAVFIELSAPNLDKLKELQTEVNMELTRERITVDRLTLRQQEGLAEEEFNKYEAGSKSLFTEELLREICLGINSMCKGAESKFFNGHTNITDDKFICFGVKGLMDSNKKLKDAMLFNILSYMNHNLLTHGNTVASIDELYLFLTNMTAIEYIRNASKRVRKKDSAIILASQNIEDFLISGIREFTKPLFSIPTHHFLFNPGNINPREFMDVLQIEQAEYDLIKFPERGTCLYKCGNERYLLQVIAPEYKAKLFGNAGGR